MHSDCIMCTVKGFLILGISFMFSLRCKRLEKFQLKFKKRFEFRCFLVIPGLIAENEMSNSLETSSRRWIKMKIK